MAKTLYLIDGHAQIYRAFYAVEGLTAPDGRPTGATYGFTRMLLDIIQKYSPDYLIAVFDPPGKTFRHTEYPEYKANRKPTPPELIQQIPLIQEIVAAYNIPVCSIPEFEADDAIGTLTKKAEALGLDVVIVTGDKDCGQLLTDHVRIYDAKKDLFITRESFIEKRGIRPEQLTDVMGLWGDTSDNIPGVPGIGEKIGCNLINTYRNLESLLDNAHEIKGKRGEILRANKEQALLSKSLATIRTDVPLELDLDAAMMSPPATEILVKIFEELDFKRLLHQFKESTPKTEEKRDYILVNTPGKFSAFMKALRHEKRFAFDTETTHIDPMLADLVGMSFSWNERTGYYLPFSAPEGVAALGTKEREQIAKVLEDTSYLKTGQNLKYDALVLKGKGIALTGIDFDTLIASKLLAGHITDHSLDTLSERHLGIEKIPTKNLIGTGRNQITMDEVPLAEITAYACEDADITFRLDRLFTKKITERHLSNLLFDLELPLSLLLTKMQATGVRLDCALLKKQSDEITIMLEALTAEIHLLAGGEFNIASTQQLAKVLFEDMGMPVIRKTKTGVSTDESTLTELAALGHELPARILDYRMYTKLKNTYLDALPTLLNPKTGRIHTTFSQTTTATGRLSSRNPNLQNIPVRTDRGRTIRAAFIPEDGWLMLAADYSQVELRMLAHFSKDPMLISAFEEGQDIHKVVAAKVNGVGLDAVTTEQRAAAKAINFGIIYGQTAHGLSQATDMSRPEAQQFIDNYFSRFPRVREWIEETRTQAHSDGEVATMLGRVRQIPDLASSNKAKAQAAEREAVNTVIQGSAADLVKTAMLNVDARMEKEAPRARMLLQIHDELLFEFPPEELEPMQVLVREEMESALPLEVPLVVDMGTGNNWLEVK